MAEPQHLRADEGVIPSNPLTAQMEKLLVNVSGFFQSLLSSRGLVFWLLLWMADWCSFSVFGNSPEKSYIFDLEGLLFKWQNVPRIVHVPSLLPTESAKEVSLEKQYAFLLSVCLRVLLYNISSNHSLITAVLNLQKLGHSTVLSKEIKWHLHMFWPRWESACLLTAEPMSCEQIKPQATGSLRVGPACPFCWPAMNCWRTEARGTAMNVESLIHICFQPQAGWSSLGVNADLRHTARRCGGVAKTEHHCSSKSSDLVLAKKIYISCISSSLLTALFASGSSLKPYSLFFKPHPHSLDFFPVCLLETVEPSPFLPSVSSLLLAGSLLLSSELSPLIFSSPELTPCVCPGVILHFSTKFHSSNVLFPWNSILAPSVVLIECIEPWIISSTLWLWMGFFCGFCKTLCKFLTAGW